MQKELNPKVGFNKDAKLVLIGILRKTIELIRLDGISEPLDIGIVAAHLRDFCCYLDCTGEHDGEGFFGGFNGETDWPSLCEKLQETSNIEWHKILEKHLDSGEWPKQESESTISMETKLA